MTSVTNDRSNPGNITPAVTNVSSNPADEYFRYKLLKAKLGTRPKADEILSSTSEQDELMYKILAKLQVVKESSPEWNQLVDVTGKQSHFDQAEELARIQYARLKSERILSRYGATKDEAEEIFDETNLNAMKVRVPGLIGPASASAASGTIRTVTAALAKAFSP